ncbi:MAG TPA: septum formation initiator family protein [Candidatus Sulfotelmatobacter sp.]|nr:septum formation initiator family protein [Candidatus Sulfotelmatobacter sp.]
MARRLLAALLAVLSGWVAYAVYGQAVQNHTLDTRVTELREQNDQLRQQIDQRRREISEAQSRAWLEEEARKLDYVMPGEKVFVITTPGAAVPARGGIDVPQLPSYAPTPPPAASSAVASRAPAATASAAPASSAAAPTPFVFTLPRPSP